MQRILRICRKCLESIREPVVGYSRLVLVLKIALAVVALALLILLVAMPILKPAHEQFHLTFQEADVSNLAKPKMLKPHLQGVDEKGQPYNITAESAVRNTEQEVILNTLQGDITLTDGSWLSVLAKEGSADIENNTLALKGDVQLFTGEGFEFRTEEAFIDMRVSSVQGSLPVTGQGPPGTLQADAFAITGGGEKILFSGKVKMKIFTRK